MAERSLTTALLATMLALVLVTAMIAVDTTTAPRYDIETCKHNWLARGWTTDQVCQSSVTPNTNTNTQ